jgi:PAS domain S-box-containing protein
VRHTSVRDISERKRAEAALQESELRYRTIFGSSPDGILLMKGERFVDCSRQAADILGSPRAQVIGRTPMDFSPEFQPDGTKSESAAWQRIHEAGTGKTTSFEWLHKRQNGDLFEAEIRLKRIDIAQGPYLLAFMRDISERKQIEHERAVLAEQIQESHDRLRLLSTDLIESQEVERRRIASELHDDIGQLLTAMKINVQQLQRANGGEEGAAGADLQFSEQLKLVDTIIERVRNLALDLRPSILDDLGLVPALRWHLDRQVSLAKIYGTLNSDKAAYPISSSVRISCFRVVQEAVNNILKHARATRIQVSLQQLDGQLKVVIADDGIGFDVAQARRESMRGESFGLLGMQERIELLGGTFEIHSELGNGSQVIAGFPLNDTPAESK